MDPVPSAIPIPSQNHVFFVEFPTERKILRVKAAKENASRARFTYISITQKKSKRVLRNGLRFHTKWRNVTSKAAIEIPVRNATFFFLQINRKIKIKIKKYINCSHNFMYNFFFCSTFVRQRFATVNVGMR